VYTLDTTTNQYSLALAERPKAELHHGYQRATQLTFQGSLNYYRTFGKNTIGFLALYESKANDE